MFNVAKEKIGIAGAHASALGCIFDLNKVRRINIKVIKGWGINCARWRRLLVRHHLQLVLMVV